MCTVSWLCEKDSLEVFFNRDESRTRQPALPPDTFFQHDARYVAAIDADAGGTWLAANELGVVVAILNYYQAQQDLASGDFISRGKLVTSLMDAGSGVEVDKRITKAFMSDYRSCILLVFEKGEGEPTRFTWDGQHLLREQLTHPMRPITTSSYRTDEVVATRLAAFDTLVDASAPTPDQLQRFHRHQHPDDPAFSVCMSRPDARTVSFSRVTVGEDSVTYSYFPHGPSMSAGRVDASLPLKETSRR
jgi:YD repeat-containing protein